jgi:hypothetical protein
VHESGKTSSVAKILASTGIVSLAVGFVLKCVPHYYKRSAKRQFVNFQDLPTT